jgi:proliferating cell nuclear antigen
MFKCVFPKEWGYDLIAAIAGTISEGNFIVTPEKLIFTAMDLSHIALIHVELPKAVFTTYECTQIETIGVNFEDFKKLTEQLKEKKEPLELSTDIQKKKILLKAKNLHPSLAMIDVEGERIDVDSLLAMKEEEGVTHFRMPKKVLVEGRKLAEIYNEVIQFTIKEEKLTLSTQGNIGDMEDEINAGDYSEGPTWGNDCQVVFANSFLKNIEKFIDLSEQDSQFFLGNEKPLIIETTIAELGKTIAVLAPRVEEEEGGAGEEA